MLSWFFAFLQLQVSLGSDLAGLGQSFQQACLLQKSSFDARALRKDGSEFSNARRWYSPTNTSVSAEEVERCAHALQEPTTEQFLHSGGAVINRSFSDIVDFIYVICVDCTGTLPSSWQGRVQLVNGKALDECLEERIKTCINEFEEIGASVQPEHHCPISFSHKFALMHAAVHGMQQIAVLEEDVGFSKSAEVLFDAELYGFIIHGTWQILRLSSFLNPFVLESQTCPCPCRRHDGAPASICTVAASVGCSAIHGAAAYLVRAPAMRALNAANGSIDISTMGSLNFTLVVPSPLHDNAIDRQSLN